MGEGGGLGVNQAGRSENFFLFDSNGGKGGMNIGYKKRSGRKEKFQTSREKKKKDPSSASRLSLGPKKFHFCRKEGLGVRTLSFSS